MSASTAPTAWLARRRLAPNHCHWPGRLGLNLCNDDSRVTTCSALPSVAEDAGFEPARACTQPAFQASAIGL